jgi:benzoyl-CoA reductase subunit C
MQHKLESKALLELEAAASIRVNPALREWKAQGGKVIGCMYHFVPEEIISAAGIVPYRMKAIDSTGCELSESCFTQVNCTFVRHLFDSGMRGNQKFLDGVVTVNNCDHIRRLYDNWESKIKTPYMHFLSFPKKRGKEQVDAYRSELAAFKKSLEDYFKVSITDERLRDAITLHNETRRLQRKLYGLRKGLAPPVTGAETLAIMIAGTAMPREHYNALLTQVIEDCSHVDGHTGHRVRVMLVGGEIDSIRFVEAVESQGGLVVADSLGYGSRAIQRDVDQNDDPLTALARYQLMERPADPRIFGTSFQRNDDVKNIADEFNVDGVISFRLLQCDHWGLEQINLSKYLKKSHLPHLALENEYILGGVGQIKTRVQAFFESIEGAQHDNN